jgi:hypothetical protein
VEGKTEYKVRDILLKELGTKINIVCSRDGLFGSFINLPPSVA